MGELSAWRDGSPRKVGVRLADRAEVSFNEFALSVNGFGSQLGVRSTVFNVPEAVRDTGVLCYCAVKFVLVIQP